MSEKKLTVAELLARAQQEGNKDGADKPRRRRSLDEGGVSVAELTGSIPTVKGAPQQSKHDRAAAAPKPVTAPTRPAAPAKPLVKKAPVTPPPSTEETVVLNVVDAEAKQAVLTTDTPKVGPVANVPVPSAKAPVQKKPPVKKAPPRTGEIPAQAATPRTPEVPAQAKAPRTGEMPAQANDVAEEKINVLAVAGMVIVGVLLGAGLFKGFEALWLRIDSILVSVMALLVTCGIIGVVHALRTERDSMSMFLAGLAGLAMTFGPVFITGF